MPNSVQELIEWCQNKRRFVEQSNRFRDGYDRSGDFEKIEQIIITLKAFLPIIESSHELTDGNYKFAERKDEGAYFECPMCDGEGCVDGEQYINFDGVALNILFSGIGNEFIKWQKFFDATVEALPAIRALKTN